MSAEIARDVALAPLTTLQLGGRAEFYVHARSEADVSFALAWARQRGCAVSVLGGGSNVLVPDAGVAGLVIDVQVRGVAHERAGATTLVRAAAGESWDELVQATVAHGLVGIECLSGIPGRVGATPIQNIGAYGQEVAQVITRVRVLDRARDTVAWLPAAACGFGYRTSRFKREPASSIVLAVEYALRSDVEPQVRYAELAAALGDTPRTPATVRAAVLELRRRKSMLVEATDENRRSVGSFFLNPIVPTALADEVVARADAAGSATAEVPRWPTDDGRVKLAAGWLIEHSGVSRGLRRGAVGVSSRHALALVHHGGGTTQALLALADEIADAVHARFGVTLEREPVILAGA